MLGESIPTKLIFFFTKYFAAEDAKPGLFLKYDSFCKLFSQPVKKTTVELFGIPPNFFSKLVISFLVTLFDFYQNSITNQPLQ
jgi:hypothetical protein